MTINYPNTGIFDEITKAKSLQEFLLEGFCHIQWSV
jgi:hypothetical protein